MTRQYVAWSHAWKLLHCMCPDGAQCRLPTAHQITISAILTTWDEPNNAHGTFNSGMVSRMRRWHANMSHLSMYWSYAFVCVLMRCVLVTAPSPKLDRSPYRAYWPQWRHKPLLMAHYIRVWYHRSVDTTTICRFYSFTKATPSYVSWWDAVEIAHSSSNHHIEYNDHHWHISPCSWPITFGCDITEA